MAKIKERQTATVMILGEVASSGLARGRAVLCDCAKQAVVPRREIRENEIAAELDRFNHSVNAVEQKLRDTQASIQRALSNTEAAIFEAQIFLVRDVDLHRAVREACVTNRINIEAAVEEAVHRLATVFDQLKDPYLRERALDLREVGKRLIDQLASQPSFDLPGGTEGCVLVTSELFSAAVAQLQNRGIHGLIVERGGSTAHATILARALGIPMLVKVPQATTKISAGDWVIVDALAGRAFINPNEATRRAYERLEADLRVHEDALRDLINVPALTKDGVQIKLSANIGQMADAVAAAQVKADGVGLYRTEFVFLAQDQFPSESEQYHFYRATAEQVKPAETVIRLLDVGSDKPLAYFPLPAEPNPALGCRGIRFLLTHGRILQAQLRAVLRLSATHPVSLLLPMIRDLDDLRDTKKVIESVKTELAAAGERFNPEIRVGVMIETPSAATLITQLADEADFFSVGTNDLVQYLLAADRIGGGAESIYEPLHPAVVRVLSRLATAAEKKDRTISLCGEIAGEPAYTALLLGLGYRSFSVSPSRCLEIKHAIRSIDLSEAIQLAGRSLTLTSAREIRSLVQGEWNSRRPVSSLELSRPKQCPSAQSAVMHDATSRRFEVRVGDHPSAFLSYSSDGDRIIFEHTFVPNDLRGKGIASNLVRAALEEAKQRRWSVVPRCSYVAAFIKRNPQFADLVATEARL